MTWRVRLLYALAALACATSGLAGAQVLKDYRCVIERTAMPQLASQAEIDAQAKNYIGQTFTVERRTGLMAGALKNSYITIPIVIDIGSTENAYKAVTTLRREQGAGRGTNIYALVVSEYQKAGEEAFRLHGERGGLLRNLRPLLRVTPLEGSSSFWQAVFVFVVADLGADARLMEEQAALKSVNEEQTASLKTALFALSA